MGLSQLLDPSVDRVVDWALQSFHLFRALRIFEAKDVGILDLVIRPLHLVRHGAILVLALRHRELHLVPLRQAELVRSAHWPSLLRIRVSLWQLVVLLEGNVGLNFLKAFHLLEVSHFNGEFLLLVKHCYKYNKL